MPRPARTRPTPRNRSALKFLTGMVGRPRLASAALLFVVLVVALPFAVAWRWPTIVLVAWNTAAAVHLTLMLHMFTTSDASTTLRRARRLDENAATILALSVVAGSASLLAILLELAIVKDLTGVERVLHVGLAAVTVVTAWSFIQVMFAIHYAHAWAIACGDAASTGIRIPGEDHPDYWDFLYVAVAIGTSGQTADVEFTGKRQRRVAMVHSALAFFFNATVLALTINIAAGLI